MTLNDDLGSPSSFYQKLHIYNLANIPQSHSPTDFLWNIEEPTFIVKKLRLHIVSSHTKIDS